MEKVWKNQKGITLVSLMVYLIGLIAVIGIVAVLTSFYSKNVATMNDTSEVNSEFNKFDAKMIQETKTAGNEIEEVFGTTIKFKNGNTYTYGDNRIYQNAVTVSKYVKDFAVNFSQDGDKQILSVYVTFGKGKIEVAKSVSYVVEVDGSEFVGGLSNVGAVSSPGITASEVAADASYIGKYVNYTVPSGGDPDVKWRIFYADSSNIYLIASDYLKYDYVPTKTVNGKEYTMYKNYDHFKDDAIYEDSDYMLSFNNMYTAYTGSADITDGRITKWMKWVGQYPSSTNENIRSVAYMLDSNIWNAKYQNSYAEYVLGGPTIEMFNASYKATHTEKYIEEEVTDAIGYKVKWNTDSSYSDSIRGLSTSELENLYVISDTTKAYAYWLASPSACHVANLCEVFYEGSVSSANSYGPYPGLRALVCLKSNVQLVPNGNAYDLSM